MGNYRPSPIAFARGLHDAIFYLFTDEDKTNAKALKKYHQDTPWILEQIGDALNLPKSVENKLRALITVKDENAVPVFGEADRDLTDTEQVPLLYEGGIEAFMQNEGLPYVPDAYIAHSKTKIGYELSFTKYFYKPSELRPLMR